MTRLLFLLPLMVISACRDGERQDLEDSGASSSLNLTEELGCDPDLDWIHSVEHRETEVANVPRLKWEASEEVQVYMASDIGDAEVLVSPLATESASSGDKLILGIPFQQESWHVVAAETSAGLVCSEPYYLAAAYLDSSIPELTLTVRDPQEAFGGYTTLSLLVTEGNFGIIIDEKGRYVWSHELKGQVNRMVFSEGESSLLYMSFAEEIDEPGKIKRMGMDGSIIEEIELTGAHTDFLQLPDGGFAAISWDLREVVDEDGSTHQFLGDRIVEVDSEGNEREVWNSFDIYTPIPGLDYMTTTVGEHEDLIDWSHGNALAYDPKTDDYMISLYGLGSLIRIDRQTGEVNWVMSDTHGDFLSDELLVQGTHSVQSLGEDTILLFNRNIPNPLDVGKVTLEGACSEAVEIQLDPETGEASRIWNYSSDECLLVLFYGEARRLENGNTMVIFSSSGQVSESNAAGETVWEIKTDMGGAFGFGERRSSLY